MGTRKYILCSNNQKSDDTYSLTTVPTSDGKGLDIKILRVINEVQPCGTSTLNVAKGYELLDFTPELYDTLYENTYDTALLYMADPYVRLKLANTEMYEAVYYQSGTYSSSLDSRSTRNYAKNLLMLDVDVLMYLYYVAKQSKADGASELFNAMLAWDIPYYPNKTNARQRLGISKNKEKVFKQHPCPWILHYDNRVFDDDIDFLFKLIAVVNNSRTNLKSILDIKAVNLKLSYQQIARNAIDINLESESLIQFGEALNHMVNHTKAYKAFQEEGLDRAMKLSKELYPSTSLDWEESNKAPTPTFKIDGAKTYAIRRVSGITYANSIAKAMPRDYIQTALSSGSHFYMIVRHGKEYLCEVKDGVVINIKRNGRNALLNVKYIMEGKGE